MKFGMGEVCQGRKGSAMAPHDRRGKRAGGGQLAARDALTRRPRFGLYILPQEEKKPHPATKEARH